MTVGGRGPANTDGVVTVGVDGSDVSRTALAWAAHDATLRAATLRVVTAWNHAPLGGVTQAKGPGRTNEDIERACHAMLDDALAETRLPSSLRVQRVVRSGRPDEVLAAAALDADVLVVGARGRGGFSRLLLGSVSSSCAQHATRPVVVVRQTSTEADARRPVLCGVDGSPDSLAALRFAAAEAALRNRPLLVVNAVYWEPSGIALIRPATGQLHEWGGKLLDSAVAGLLDPAQRRTTETRTVEGHPGEVLGDLSGHADLLVVGTAGRPAITAALLGSVSSYCLRRADCPVAVVPATGERAAPKRSR